MGKKARVKAIMMNDKYCQNELKAQQGSRRMLPIKLSGLDDAKPPTRGVIVDDHEWSDEKLNLRRREMKYWKEARRYDIVLIRLSGCLDRRSSHATQCNSYSDILRCTITRWLQRKNWTENTRPRRLRSTLSSLPVTQQCLNH